MMTPGTNRPHQPAGTSGDMSVLGNPYCGACKYDLTGAVDSSRCPECGRPLVEVLMRPTIGPTGRRFRSRTRLWGLPIIDIALGPHGTERIGRARGIFALGDDARGVVAVGGRAIGGVAIGGIAAGGLTMGGTSFGLVGAVGGVTMGAFAMGGVAIGGVVNGGMAIGAIAQGGMAAGLAVRGGALFGRYIQRQGAPGEARATELFGMFDWFLGSATYFGPITPVLSLLVILGAMLVCAGLTALLCLLAARKTMLKEDAL